MKQHWVQEPNSVPPSLPWQCLNDGPSLCPPIPLHVSRPWTQKIWVPSQKHLLKHARIKRTHFPKKLNSIQPCIWAVRALFENFLINKTENNGDLRSKALIFLLHLFHKSSRNKRKSDARRNTEVHFKTYWKGDRFLMCFIIEKSLCLSLF